MFVANTLILFLKYFGLNQRRVRSSDYGDHVAITAIPAMSRGLNAEC